MDSHLGGSLELARFLTPRWSVGFGFEALKDSSPRGIVESETFLGFSLLFAHHRPLTDRLTIQVSGGIGALKDTSDFPGVRRVDNNLAFPVGLSVPIRASRGLEIVPQFRIEIVPETLNALVTVRAGVRWVF